MKDEAFQELVWRKGKELYRSMPWRDDTRPYYVLVSELMLQQTQVTRVMTKFHAFIEQFPDERTLAKASLADVLIQWQGLGYNRRAKYLHEAARQIVERHNGLFPTDRADILALPGVGPNTAGAIEAYAFNRPSVFIETNIRTVYIHHFFADDFDVDDGRIIEKLKATVPGVKGKEQPDEAIHSLPGEMRKTVGSSYGPQAFYWALMDYGSWLKRSGVRNVARSRHYRKQAPLEGSVRQTRGRIVAVLGRKGGLDQADLAVAVGADERFLPALNGLKHDGLVAETAGHIHLTK